MSRFTLHFIKVGENQFDYQVANIIYTIFLLNFRMLKSFENRID